MLSRLSVFLLSRDVTALVVPKRRKSTSMTAVEGGCVIALGAACSAEVVAAIRRHERLGSHDSRSARGHFDKEADFVDGFE